jgi:hypothetical protein
MEKGKYGIYLWFYAVMAFVFTAAGDTTLGILLLGFVLVVEKNEWLTKQVLQAFCLALFKILTRQILSRLSISNFIYSPDNYLYNTRSVVYTLINGFNYLISWINSLIGLFVLILCIVGIIKVVKGQDAGIPLIAKLVNRAFGIVEKKKNTNGQNNQPPIPPQPNQ